jgi:hypothetical protein
MSSNPIDNVDGEYIAGEVAILRVAEPNMTCLLVEGQDDVTVYRNFVNSSQCHITNCYGKSNLLEAIRRLNEAKTIIGYLGIKDADFDFINSVPLQPNILMTDGHDLETMICASEALDKFIAVRLRGDDIGLVKIVANELRIKLFQVGAVIGYMNWLACKHVWGIAVQTHRLLNHLNENLELQLQNCLLELKALHPHIDEGKHNQQELEYLCLQFPTHLCTGHDLINILTHLFSKVTKRILQQKRNPGDVADALFLAYEYPMFRKSTLYTSIRIWEGANVPFRVLVD